MLRAHISVFSRFIVASGQTEVGNPFGGMKWKSRSLDEVGSVVISSKVAELDSMMVGDEGGAGGRTSRTMVKGQSHL